LPELAALGITLTVHNRESLSAVLDHAPGARFWFKVDTGLARYGFSEAGWPQVLEQYRNAGHEGLRGVYTHLGQAQASTGATTSIIRYEQMLAIARTIIDRPLLSMAAASPTLLSRPPLAYDCADPGRALYGMLPPSEAGGHHLRPVVTSVTSVLLDSRDVSEVTASLGYGKDGPSFEVTRVGTVPIGHFDGLSAAGEPGSVLIRGKEVRILARTLLASIVDLSDVPEAVDGDVITLVGRSGSMERDLFGFAASMQTSVTALHFTLIRNLPKVVAASPIQ
jgi:alanine racemase